MIWWSRLQVLSEDVGEMLVSCAPCEPMHVIILLSLEAGGRNSSKHYLTNGSNTNEMQAKHHIATNKHFDKTTLLQLPACQWLPHPQPSSSSALRWVHPP